jgi:hypothetical protein
MICVGLFFASCELHCAGGERGGRIHCLWRQHVSFSAFILYISPTKASYAIGAADDALNIHKAMHGHPLGQSAVIIGEVIEDSSCYVLMRIRMGGRRMVDWFTGNQLPRIC